MKIENLSSSVVLINLDVSIWSGRKKLTAADLGDAAKHLPPSDLASLGSKKICDPKALNVFDTLKSKARREILRHGIRFLGAFAVPTSKAQELAETLEEIQEEFETARTEYLVGFSDEVEKWITSHPSWERVIRPHIPDVSHIKSRLTFEWQSFKVESSSIRNCGLDKAVSGMSQQLLLEISQEAFTFYEASILGRTAGSQKTIRPLRTMLNKLEGLSFLDPSISKVSSMIDSVIKSLPTSGPLGPDSMAMIAGVVTTLMDADRLKAYAQAKADSSTDDQDVSDDDASLVTQDVRDNLFDDLFMANTNETIVRPDLAAPSTGIAELTSSDDDRQPLAVSADVPPRNQNAFQITGDIFDL